MALTNCLQQISASLLAAEPYARLNMVPAVGFAAEPAVAGLAVQHLQIRAFAAPAVMVLLVVNGAFRGFRDTK